MLTDDRPGEACGVFGVRAPGRSVAHLTYDGLYALQHRGQESAGMAVGDGDTLTVVKDMGLVTQVFDERTLSPLQGHLAIGHTRYSTTGSSTWGNAQPVYRDTGRAGFALAHNGNLTNTAALARALGLPPGTPIAGADATAWSGTLGALSGGTRPPAAAASDTDLVAEAVARACADGTDLVDALVAVLPRLEGAFSFVAMDEDRLVGARDPNGFRPLCLGRLDGGPDGAGGWVLASETPALDVVGAEFVREVAPGEVVVVDASGPRSRWPFPPEQVDPKLCLFEFVYFARPDAELYGQEVHGARLRMGELLAGQAPLPPDAASPARSVMVMGVPDSGLPAAEGFARASGVPYGQGLVKNRYIGRTFIAPDQGQRARGVRRKLNPLKAVAGKRLVVVDDSIVRGTTTRAMVAMLREAGAAEVHLRVSSPPYRWPCFYGMDTGSRAELLAAHRSVDEVRDYLGVDTLAYLELDRLVEAVGTPGAGFCTACLTGEYPVAVPVDLTEKRPERSDLAPARG